MCRCTWDQVFREIRRRRVNGGPKTIGAHEIVFRGRFGGQEVVAVSRVRLNDPMESFRTSSGHRLRDSKVGDAGHWVDLRIITRVTDQELEQLGRMASAVDTRVVVTTRGPHLPARPAHHDDERNPL